MLMKSFGLQSPIGKKTRTAYILAPKFGQYTKEHGGRYTRERCIEARVSMLILFHELDQGSSVGLLDATTDGRPSGSLGLQFSTESLFCHDRFHPSLPQQTKWSF